jgi:DNA-binding CsgD family transcriptional regulator
VVGREAELAQVAAFLEAADRGFAALLVEGEPGIGKTTIWREAQRRAEARGCLVLSCRASAAEAKLSFAALADVLSSVDDAAFARLPPPQLEAIDVALLRAAPAGAPPSARAVAAGVLTLVQELARHQTVILAVDDAQWLDPPSRSALEFAARRLEREPVGLLCAVRGTASGFPVRAGLAEGRLTRHAIGPLSLGALGQIISRKLGRSLPRPLLARINNACAGNPFYALEIGRLLVEAGVDQVPGAELPVPDDLRALDADRIRRLPSSAREALLLAAVLSTPTTQAIDPTALEPAEEAGIVTIDARGRIEFAHPLLASAAYGSVSGPQRRALHVRAAALVSDPEQRARHLALASRRADAEVGRGLDEAATLAALRGAPDAAAELAELAVEHTAESDVNARGLRLVGAARFHFEAGSLARAQTLSEAALALNPSPEVRTLALHLGAQLLTRRSNFTAAAELATAALQAAGDERTRAAVELELVFCAVSLGDLGGAEAHAQAAARHAEAAGERGMLADALAVLTLSRFLTGRGLDATGLQRALELEDPLMPRSWIMRPSVIHGMIRLWTGDLAGALHTLGAVHTESIERGLEGFVPLLSFYLVWAAVWSGDLELASRLSAEARTAAALLEDATTLGLALTASALVHAHDGHSDLARSEAGDALALFEQLQWRSGVIWPLWALGLAALSDGEPAQVDAVLGPLTEQVAAMGAGDPVLTMFLPDEVEALVTLGQLDRAETYLAAFESRARELDRAWALAAAERCRGALAAARGEKDLAFAAFERALAEHERTAMPFERARTLLLAGQAYRRNKQRAQARKALSAGLELFERSGAIQWAARTRRELARLGGPTADPDDLTPTERAVAELAASGLTNQEVAERAFLSVKTVEANLTRAYRKLGVGSRVGLANALRSGTLDGIDSAHGSPST